ncbi:uncharacterized protein EV154DRAFT_579720 [Mucor mucedo]|uniref:uncharacterized protein n=1 Tax=Mucor mucedo TaxID=29922 RepID=UPI002220A485|nr:uncharacterized protein EV154DRAFT_579720 [Mucor mucedo]KAI7872262.1 hypothetical protein EV154DRAFT_579720 [Mucor mucedo]
MLRNPTEYHLMESYQMDQYLSPFLSHHPLEENSMLIPQQQQQQQQQQLPEDRFSYAPCLDYLSWMDVYHHSPSETDSRQDYESIQKNHQLLAEKKRRRRESHNAVERRRRENINERIQELGTMLPEAQEKESVVGGNKGAILRKSVNHIRNLQRDVALYKQRIHELESQLASI